MKNRSIKLSPQHLGTTILAMFTVALLCPLHAHADAMLALAIGLCITLYVQENGRRRLQRIMRS